MKYRILFAEDEKDLGNVVKQYLELMDFEVHWYTSGKQAIETFARQPAWYDIALLDISMPDMDGFELSERLINIDPNLSFLFLTARTEKKDKLHGLRLGADDYITKPFDIDELILRIRNILRRKQSNLPAAAVPPVIERSDVRFNKESLKLYVAR